MHRPYQILRLIWPHRPLPTTKQVGRFTWVKAAKRCNSSLIRILFFVLAVWSCWFWVNPNEKGVRPVSAHTLLSETNETIVVGQVWKDINWDGVQQFSEPFIPYTLVALYRHDEIQGQSAAESATPTATPILTTTTTITGWYEFRGLASGSYTLEFVTPGAMTPTRSNVGTNDAIDSDIVEVNDTLKGQFFPLVISNSSQLYDIDAGFVAVSRITLYVYDDLNQDHKRQVNEKAVPGTVAVLYLIKDNGPNSLEVSQMVVGEDGAAKFIDLRPGQYTIQVVPPDGYTALLDGLLPAISLLPGANMRLEAPLFQTPNTVDLVSFTVEQQDHALHVRWVTSAENNTYGFRLVQQNSVAAANTIQFTSDLIPSQGSLGGVYQVELPFNPIYDSPYETMLFWLVEYEITGNQNRYGPFSTTSSPLTRWFFPLIIQ
jgi:hypothetical protein